ncbi:hypothetical protein ABW19_dt0203263 [Dactylella cylindrospora]|nr:hypothetical protein ABW19_dt0203263 [Dactylella cylindrospora]
MQFKFLSVLLLLFIGFVSATAMARPAPPIEDSWMLTFPNDTPQAVYSSLVGELKGLGGVITHEYSLIK